jgi:hypothetical protein
MSADLAKLPRLGDEVLGPCTFCGTLILDSGAPLFYRVTVRQCGVDANAVRQRLGLAMMMGGGADGLALSGLMGAHDQPVVVLGSVEANVCHSCFTRQTSVLEMMAGAQ